MKEYADKRMIEILGRNYNEKWNTEIIPIQWVYIDELSPIYVSFCSRLYEANRVGVREYLPFEEREEVARKCYKEIEEEVIDMFRNHRFYVNPSEDIGGYIVEKLTDSCCNPKYPEAKKAAEERAEAVKKEWNDLVERLEDLHTRCLLGQVDDPPGEFRKIEREYL